MGFKPMTKYSSDFKISKEKAYKILKVSASGISKEKACYILAFMGFILMTSSVEYFPESFKNSGLYGIQTHDLLQIIFLASDISNKKSLIKFRLCHGIQTYDKLFFSFLNIKGESL